MRGLCRVFNTTAKLEYISVNPSTCNDRRQRSVVCFDANRIECETKLIQILFELWGAPAERHWPVIPIFRNRPVPQRA